MVVGSDSDKGLTLRNASVARTMPSAERRAPSAERRAPSAERRAPSAERRAPSAERRAPSAERRAPSAERRAPSAERRAPSAERRAPSAERRREHAGPPAPPDRLPPRRGRGSSPSPCTYTSAAGRAARPARLSGARVGLVRRAAAALLVLLAATAAFAPTARAQDITALQATMTVGHSRTDTGTIAGVETYFEEHGYDAPDQGSLSPAQFSYPTTSEGSQYSVSGLSLVTQVDFNNVIEHRVQLFVEGPYSSHRPDSLLPLDVGLTLHLDAGVVPNSFSLSDGDPQWQTEDNDGYDDRQIVEQSYAWYDVSDSTLAVDDTVTVRLTYPAPPPFSDEGLFDVGTVDSSPDPSIAKVFRFNLKAEAYRFRISTDARVTVTDPDGTELWKESLNSGSVLEERFTSTVAGEHKVTISHGAYVSARPFYFTLLPVNEEPAATLSLRRDPQITATLNTYGDRDTWGVAVDPGAAYAVRVRGREDGQGTAATPSIRRTDPPGSYTDYRMDKPWVDGVSIAKASALCHQLAEPEKCEYQAFVIDLRGVTGAEQRFEIDVGPTQRPDTRPYREGTYEVDLRQLSSSQLQGVRMPLRAWFTSPPAQHDGSKRFQVQVGFSDALDGSPEDGVEVKGGEVTSVGPAEGNAPAGAAAARGAAPQTTRSVGGPDGEVVWEFEIEPDSDADVTVSVAAWRPCNEPGAICTPDERVLSQGDSTTVRGPGDGPAPNTPAAGAPTIGGTPQVGEELTALTSGDLRRRRARGRELRLPVDPHGHRHRGGLPAPPIRRWTPTRARPSRSGSTSPTTPATRRASPARRPTSSPRRWSR